jgi:hypothetical protein
MLPFIKDSDDEEDELRSLPGSIRAEDDTESFPRHEVEEGTLVQEDSSHGT